MDENKSVLLVGCGNMAIEYAKALKALGVRPNVVGRSKESADNFMKMTAIPPNIGGLTHWLKSQKGRELPTHAIVAVNIIELDECAELLITIGVENILLEKPGSLNWERLIKLSDMAKKYDAKVSIAYNRRFYQSVTQARKILNDDRGLLSFHFEFTEWDHVIRKTQHPQIVKANWLVANSSHVIDLAFYLGGLPTEMNCHVAGALDWHPSGSMYFGSGKSGSILFSYQANWQAPGRWKVELHSRSHRLLLSPLEKLSVQKHGKLDFEEIPLEPEYDRYLKPGIFLLTQSFLSTDSCERILSLQEYLKRFYVFDAIKNGMSLSKNHLR